MIEFDRAFAAYIGAPAFVPRVTFFRSVLASDVAPWIALGWRACGVDVKPSVADFILLMQSETGVEP